MIERGDRPPVVYLVQPLLKRLGQSILHSAADPDLAAAVGVVMDGSGPCTRTLPDRDRRATVELVLHRRG